jgi:hypothetical protein
MKNVHRINHHIYITSDEQIKYGDWHIYVSLNAINKRQRKNPLAEYPYPQYQKIILTTDWSLDGVQLIDYTLIEWFVKNPSCEEIWIDKNWNYPLDKSWEYKIIIPQEEAKQRAKNTMALKGALDVKEKTLEEAAEKEFPLIDTEWCKTGAAEEENLQLLGHRKSFIEGAKWQAERIPLIIEEYLETAFISKEQGYMNPKDWFEQFKKKGDKQ